MRHLYLFILLGFFTACTNIEDAAPADRDTFIRFYEKNMNYTGVVAELTEDGFIVAGNMQQDTTYNAVITKTDNHGISIWEVVLPNTSVKSIKAFLGGYLVFGDSIQVDKNAENVNDQLVTKARLIKMGANGEPGPSISLFNRKEPKTDFHASALTFNAAGQIISIGTFKSGSSTGRAFVTAHKVNELDTAWTQYYSLQDRDYSNSKSAYVTTAGKILWASSALKEQQSSSQSYVIVPVIEPNSTFTNSSLFGENADQYYSAEDIQPSGIGYGIVGTYSNIQKTNSNIFFVRADASGYIIKGSEKYYDGQPDNNDNILVNAGDSRTDDKGTALAPTTDGGFLLGGSLLTNTVVGKGGTDIYLIRIDAFGNVIWKKNIGGSGDETVSSIRTTSDGGFLICGTSTVNGLSSVYIMKIDKNGDISK